MKMKMNSVENVFMDLISSNFLRMTFAPIENLPNPNYIMGPGDVLRVNFFGNVTKERELLI